MLQQIPTKDVHRITSGQVIVDLKSCVKELVENSIDAHATRIDIVMKNYGVDSIELSDDGDGIQEPDYDKICLNHYTSKIEQFEDIDTVKTFGFRGEAMSSICGIADVSITTKTETDTVSTQLRYDHRGNLTKRTKGPAKLKGCKIVVENLFANLPVRRKNFVKNSKKEFVKLIQLIQQYCVITPLKFSFHHIVNDKKKLVVSSSGSESMIDRIAQVYNNNKPYVSSLDELGFEIEAHGIVVSGYISNCSFGQGRSSNDRQMLFFNGRPAVMPKFNKMVNEIYKTFNHLEVPSFFIDLQMDSKLLDLNVTPDKMTIMLANENDIFESFKEKLVDFYAEQDHILPKNQNEYFKQEEIADAEEIVEDQVTPDTTENGDDSTAGNTTAVSIQIRENIKKRSRSANNGNDIFMNIGGRSIVESYASNRKRKTDVSSEDDGEDEDDNDLITPPTSDIVAPGEMTRSKLKTSNLHGLQLQLDINETEILQFPRDPAAYKPNTRRHGQLKEEVDDVMTLNRISFNKKQFLEMQVIGQFNLGFIIVKLELDNVMNLFIVDQHASDEKYNYERLCNETVLQSQKLITPMKLKLSSMDELVVLDNMDVFKQNGFDLEVEQDNSISVNSIPISKKTVFNDADLEELIQLLKDQTYHSKIPRPSKIYRMFASRACRSSTMIGDHLTHEKMNKLVKQLSEIEKPWNCPHGRPTMRHLIELTEDALSMYVDDYI